MLLKQFVCVQSCKINVYNEMSLYNLYLLSSFFIWCSVVADVVVVLVDNILVV